MEKIKYHQNGTDNEYGADGHLTDNWNPDKDYGNEYVNIHFRIEAKHYDYLSYNFSKSERIEFYNEVKNALYPLGWKEEDGEDEWGCGDIIKGKQHLYLHPQDFSGEILKNEVKIIAEALKEHNSFYLRWVDLYKTVYDMSDDEYNQYLETRKNEIKKDLFENFTTPRTNKYYYTYDVSMKLFSKYGLKRIGVNDGLNYSNGQTVQFIKIIIEGMIKEGLLVGIIDEDKYANMFRSFNKTEKSKLKVKIA